MGWALGNKGGKKQKQKRQKRQKRGLTGPGLCESGMSGGYQFDVV